MNNKKRLNIYIAINVLYEAISGMFPASPVVLSMVLLTDCDSVLVADVVGVVKHWYLPSGLTFHRLTLSAAATARMSPVNDQLTLQAS
jgi:hypothetical protein